MVAVGVEQFAAQSGQARLSQKMKTTSKVCEVCVLNESAACREMKTSNVKSEREKEIVAVSAQQSGQACVSQDEDDEQGVVPINLCSKQVPLVVR